MTVYLVDSHEASADPLGLRAGRHPIRPGRGLCGLAAPDGLYFMELAA